MEVTLLSSSLPDLLPMRNRSPGIHISDVITRYCHDLGLLSRDKESDLSTTWAQCGCSWEWATIERYIYDDPDNYAKGIELCVDSLYGTPDLYRLSDAGQIIAIEEIKLSWMSSKHDIHSDKFWRYRTQLMAYCYMQGVREGVLNVTFVNGDWKGSGPQNRTWGLRWSEQELLENWFMLRSKAEVMRSETR